VNSRSQIERLLEIVKIPSKHVGHALVWRS